jgi:hypothetical protein
MMDDPFRPIDAAQSHWENVIERQSLAVEHTVTADGTGSANSQG